MVTQAKKVCKTIDECDARYIMQQWFWRAVALGILACVVTVFAVGGWKANMENADLMLSNSVNELRQDVNQLKSIQADIDTVKGLLRK